MLLPRLWVNRLQKYHLKNLSSTSGSMWFANKIGLEILTTVSKFNRLSFSIFWITRFSTSYQLSSLLTDTTNLFTNFTWLTILTLDICWYLSETYADNFCESAISETNFFFLFWQLMEQFAVADQWFQDKIPLYGGKCINKTFRKNLLFLTLFFFYKFKCFIWYCSKLNLRKGLVSIKREWFFEEQLQCPV